MNRGPGIVARATYEIYRTSHQCSSQHCRIAIVLQNQVLPSFNMKTIFPHMGIPMIKLRWSPIMGIPIPVRWHFYIEAMLREGIAILWLFFLYLIPYTSVRLLFISILYQVHQTEYCLLCSMLPKVMPEMVAKFWTLWSTHLMESRWACINVIFVPDVLR